jgi:hypothetical protein
MTGPQFRLTLVAVVLSGLLGGGLVSWLGPGRAAQAQPLYMDTQVTAKLMIAQKFQLLDKAGKLRMTIGPVVQGDQPGIMMYDEQGRNRATLGLILGEGDPGLMLYDAGGKARVRLALGTGPGLRLFDSQGKERTRITVAQDSPTLAIVGDDGTVQFQRP